MSPELTELMGRCRALGEAFRGRLDDDVLDDALAYFDFNESVLALDVLASQLYEHDVAVHCVEVAEFQKLLTLTGGDPDRVAFLRELAFADSAEIGSDELGDDQEGSPPDEVSEGSEGEGSAG